MTRHCGCSNTQVYGAQRRQSKITCETTTARRNQYAHCRAIVHSEFYRFGFWFFLFFIFRVISSRWFLITPPRPLARQDPQRHVLAQHRAPSTVFIGKVFANNPFGEYRLSTLWPRGLTRRVYYTRVHLGNCIIFAGGKSSPKHPFVISPELTTDEMLSLLVTITIGHGVFTRAAPSVYSAKS